MIAGDPESLRDTLRADLTEAMRSGERHRIAAIRSLMAALANAESVPTDAGSDPVPFGRAEVPRAALDGPRAERVLRSEIGDRRDVLVHYDRHRDGSHAAGVRAEIDVLDRYLAAFTTGP